MSLRNPFSLEGLNILITGASSGIGAETARVCAQMGATVIGVARNAEKLTAVFEALEKDKSHLAFSGDVTSESDIERLVKLVKDYGLKIHGIVHSAGISKTLPLGSSKENPFDEIMKTNTYSGLNLIRHFSRTDFLPESGASYVLVASAVAHAGFSGKALYSASKGALVSMSRALAVELASKGVRVNTISPGVILTPMADKSPFRESVESLSRVEKLHPLGLGEPRDVANACVYLLSDASRWVTGTDLRVDGGFTAH